MPLKNKVFSIVSDFTVKDAGADSTDLIIEGYANTTTKDRVGDVIVESAWNQGGLDNYKKNPIILAYHQYDKPIGLAQDISVDSKGLKITAKISKAAGDIVELIKDGILKAFSVGFRVKDAVYDQASDIFVIKDLELYEISVVSVPANTDSIFSLKKNFESDKEYKEFIKELTNDTTTNVVDPLVKIEETIKNQNNTLEAVFQSITEVANSIKQDKEKENKEMPDITDGTPNVEKLLKELEDRILEKGQSTSQVIDELRAELVANKAQLDTLKTNKMEFENKAGLDKITVQDKCNAVLLSKILNKPIESTKFAKNIIEKSGAQHYNADDNWEQTFSTTVFNAIRQELVVEPLFTRKVTMTTPVMHFPVNPDAGVGYWIPTGDFNTAKSAGDDAQSDIPQVQQLSDEDLTAFKVASKEYLGYEEDEDSLIPLLPIIQDAITRRMARTSDIAFLRGAGSGSAQPTYDPISGVCTRAASAGGVQVTTKGLSAGKVTVADLATIRRGLGIYGLSPASLVYVVSLDVYYDLLDDPDFRTTDLVGVNATILTGQIGAVNGVRVVVSGEFAAKANGAMCAVCINQSNFLVGELRSLLVERWRDIVQQQTVLVSTRRLAFRDIIAGKGSSVLKWIT